VYLLDFGSGAFEQLNVTVANALTMFGQCFVGAVVAGEQHERVAGRTPVSLVYEQDTFLAVQHVHWCQTLLEEFQLHNDQHNQGRFRQLRAWCERTLNSQIQQE